MHKYSREWCVHQDAEDLLRDKRPLFDIPENIIYMDGNSLGVMTHAARDAIARVSDEEWTKGLIKSWNTADWIGLTERVGAKIAPLIGAEASEVVLADSTSVNIFKTVAAAAAINTGRSKIVSETGNFPTDLYMIEGLTQFMKGELSLETCDRGDIISALDEDVAVLLLTHVHYVTGEMFDMPALTKAAQDKGIVVVWDLSHSTGAVEVDLNRANADFAVGCGYKYLNGGPGAPAFIYAAKRHHSAMQQPLSGWFGHKAMFAFRNDFEANDGIKRMLTGTTPVLAASTLEAALSVFDEVDMSAVVKKSCSLSDMFIHLVQTEIDGVGFILATPEDARVRGSHVSLRHENGYQIMAALIDHGVIGDFRAPENIRFGFTPLYLSYQDVWDAVETLKRIMKKSLWDNPKYARKNKVT